MKDEQRQHSQKPQVGDGERVMGANPTIGAVGGRFQGPGKTHGGRMHASTPRRLDPAGSR